MNSVLLMASVVFLIVFAILSFVDGVYLHLIKFRLPENPDSRREHLAHTARAFLFLPVILLLFVWNVSGPWLWVLGGLLTLDLAIEAWDVLEERGSRAGIGGLTGGEYLLHAVLVTTRVASVTLALTSKPVEAWSGQMSLPVYPPLVAFVGWQLIPGAVLIAVVHVALIFRPRLVSEAFEWAQEFKCCRSLR